VWHGRREACVLFSILSWLSMVSKLVEYMAYVVDHLRKPEYARMLKFSVVVTKYFQCYLMNESRVNQLYGKQKCEVR